MTAFSIYIHWPFCESKCPYCDFNSHVEAVNQEEFLVAYKTELKYYFQEYNFGSLRSVFFGGGTPSLMEPRIVSEILDFINRSYSIKDAEITLEANPSSIEASKFRGFRDAGVNRISLGIQSLNEQALKFLGRKHSANEAINAIDITRGIFDNYSLDFIYAHEKHTPAQWSRELEFIIQNYAKDHLSLYTLTIEKGTDFYKLFKENKISTPNDDELFEFYDTTNNILEANGFVAYEISNYAKNNKQSKHNMSYWSSVDYLGIGAGAHGRISLKKDGQVARLATQNQSAPRSWLKAVLERQNGLQNTSIISDLNLVNEILLMNMRVRGGINLPDIQQKFNLSLLNFLDSKKLEYLLQDGLIEYSQTHLRYTNKGRYLLDSIVRYLSLDIAKGDTL